MEIAVGHRDAEEHRTFALNRNTPELSIFMENHELSPAEPAISSPEAAERAIPLSSTGTLFWRVFIPVFGTVFMLGLTLAFWLTEEDDLRMPFVPVAWARILILVLLFAWLLFIRRTLWRLKRIDADNNFIYVTNYWITLRYAWQDVDRIEIKHRLGRRILNLWLKAPGRFGQIISFLPVSHFDTWMAAHAKAGLMAKAGRGSGKEALK